MNEYSAQRLLREGLGGQRGWKPRWQSLEPKDRHDVVVVRGHGPATAYYLASNHGVTNVAVVEGGRISGGNAKITRSNYYNPQSACARTTVAQVNATRARRDAACFDPIVDRPHSHSMQAPLEDAALGITSP